MTDLGHTLQESIDAGLGALREGQLPSGQFNLDFMRRDSAGELKFLAAELSPFGTVHIAYSLGCLSQPEAKKMTARAVEFLQAQKIEPGLWRYFNKEHRRHGAIPFDLDDTACISELLRRNNQDVPDNKQFFLLNRDRRGRFYTWLIPRLRSIADFRSWWTLMRDLNFARVFRWWQQTPSRPDDVDGVVNANILLYLGQRPETEPVIDYLIGIIADEREDRCDKWYPSRFSFYHAVSRNYAAGITRLEKVRTLIVERIEAHAGQDGQIGENELETALAACALLNFGIDAGLLDRAVAYLVRAQQQNGAWPRWPYYFGGPAQGFSWGSQELTTGFCLEALERYQTRTIHTSGQGVAN